MIYIIHCYNSEFDCYNSELDCYNLFCLAVITVKFTVITVKFTVVDCYNNELTVITVVKSHHCYNNSRSSLL